MSGRQWIAGLGAAVLVAVGVSAFSLHDAAHHQNATLAVTAEDPSPEASSTPRDAPSATSAPPVGQPAAHVAPTSSPASSEPDDSAAPGLPARCRGPLLPGEPSDAACDELHPHSGLPSPCIAPGNACSWPDSHGASSLGMSSMRVDVRGTTLHVVWTNPDFHSNESMSAPHTNVLRLLRPDMRTVLVTRLLPMSQHETDFADLAPGSYAVLAQELNVSGLSAGIEDLYDVAFPPSPSPKPMSPTPRPSLSPKPDVTPASEPSPTTTP